MKGLLAKTKPMARSDLASEAVWRPKQPRGICLKKYGGYLNLVNEFQFAVKNQEVLLTTRGKPMARSVWPLRPFRGQNSLEEMA